MIAQPFIIGLRDWADQVVFDLDQYGPLARLDDETRWQEWALQFCVISGLSQKNPPDPYSFSDWKTWAERFVEVIN